jgi:hypothetical protein
MVGRFEKNSVFLRGKGLLKAEVNRMGDELEVRKGG